MTAAPSPPADQIAEELMQLTGGLRRTLRRQLRPQMPTPRLRGAEIELLGVVEHQPGIGVAAAARTLGLAGNSVSTLVNRLVENGLLHREADPTDRRAVRLRITPAAAQRIATWRKQRARLVGCALAMLPADDQQALAAALPALRRLVEAMEAAVPYSRQAPAPAGSREEVTR